MSSPPQSSYLPLAYAALEALPAIHAEVAPGLRRQAARAAAYLGRALARPQALAALEAMADDPCGGLVVVEGPAGSGVTTLLAALAARRAMPLWLADDVPDGLPALYAQVIGLRRPSPPLIDPASLTDPTALDRLLTAAAGQGGERLALLVDLPAAGTPPARPLAPILPGELPPGVTLVLGCTPGAPLPWAPRAHLRLPDGDPGLAGFLARALAAARCDAQTAEALLGAACGSPLYIDLAAAWLADGLIDPAAPPAGLDGLFDLWWGQLDGRGRRLAHLLAAAGEPLPLPLAAELLGADPEPLLTRWEALRLVDLAVQSPARSPDQPPGQPVLLAGLAHGAARQLLASRAPAELARAHGDLAGLGRARLGGPGARGAGPAEERYLSRQLARHAALAPPEEGAPGLAHVTARDWVRAHERQDSLAAAHSDAAWEMRAAADGPPLRAARAAALAGTLASRARTLDGDSAVEALVIGIEGGGREAALKGVLELVERLPDGMGKAQILRRLGEACYGARMRSSAMRLLSRALDLEAGLAPRSWREQREQLFVALASAAVGLGEDAVALAIGERIEHLERRAAVETQVTRHLIGRGELERARRVAREILHESMGAWARAEVAVALSRAGDARGAMILEEISIETVAAWAQIELACDLAATDDVAARARIEALPTPGQRDRGLARLAHALAAAQKDGDALAAAEQIGAVEVRVAALLDLRLTLEGLVAMLALERVTSDIGAITGDDRAPLLAALAAAHAAIGRRESAIQIAEQLPQGEERDRALAKVAVAIAQSGDYPAAQATLARLEDDDERDWAKDEIARLLAASGRWEECLALVATVVAADQRARTGADLAIERARAGDPLAALAQARAIALAGERGRALTLVAPLLVGAGHIAEALAVAAGPELFAGPEARGRYLAIVAAALAVAGRYGEARATSAGIGRPIDRARAQLALALALIPVDRAGAEAALGAALQAATVGREETMRALELSAPAFAALGGGELLGAVAAAVDEIDRWI